MGSSLYLCRKNLCLKTCSVQVCEEAGHSTDLVGKGGRAGNSTWWDEPWERVTGTRSPSTVCVFTAWFCLWVIWNISGISLAVAWRKRVSKTSVVVVGTFIQLYFEYCKVCFVGVSCAFQTAKEETIIFKTEKIMKQFCSTYSTVNTWVLWKPTSSLLLHWESRMKIVARCC